MSTQYAYHSAYTSSGPRQCHRYLWPALIKELSGIACLDSAILDAGCGNGAFCGSLRDRIGCSPAGCDLSESGIAVARETHPDCEFRVASVTDDLVATFERRFDVIMSIEVVEHLYDPHLFVRRMREALVPGGRLLLTTPYHGWLKNVLVAAMGRYDTHHNPLAPGGHVKFWSIATITRLLRDGGMDVRRVTGCGRLPGIWKSMIVTAVSPST